jgi:hypothetical protein
VNRTRELEQPPLTVRQSRGGHVGEVGQPDTVERGGRVVPPPPFVCVHRRSREAAGGDARETSVGGREQHVLEARQVRVCLRRLERAQDPVRAHASRMPESDGLAEDLCASGRVDDAAQRVQERRLP